MKSHDTFLLLFEDCSTCFLIDLCPDKLFWGGARRKMMNCVVSLVRIVTDSQMNSKAARWVAGL